MNMINLRTSEQVSKYHPDKIADQLSDYVLEHASGGVGGVEVMVKSDTVIVAGEVKKVPRDNELRDLVIKKCEELRYYPTNIINLLEQQSVEINKAVFSSKVGAGDQGFVYGYAKRGNEQYLSHDMYIANKVIEYIEELGFNPNKFPYLKGDAKTQVFVDSDNNVVKLVVSAAHSDKITLSRFKEYIKTALASKFDGVIDSDVIEVNPAGSWTVCGPYADAGLTGRKIVADQYGGRVPVGGGAFSGKDLTKVDRSGAYALRMVAVDLLKKYKFIDEVLIEAGYIIGKSNPYSLYVTINGQPHKAMTEIVNESYDLTVNGLMSLVVNSGVNFKKISSGNHMKWFL